MDRYKRIQIISCVIVFVVLIGLAIWFLSGNVFVTHGRSYQIENIGGSYDEVGRYNIETADIDEFDINWIAGVVTVTPYNGNDIELVEYAQRDLKVDEDLIYNTVNNKLKIRFCEEKKRFFDHLPPKKLEIFLPAALAGNLRDFIISSVSAPVNISEITTDYLEVDTVSGESGLSKIKAGRMILGSVSGKIDMIDSDADQISLDTVSGRLSINQITSSKLTANSTSGDMMLEDIVTERLYFDTTSGDITFLGSFQDLIADSTSGEFIITDKEIPDSFKFDTVSGDVDLTMPTLNDFNLKFDTVSGDLESELPTISGKGNSDYRIDTTSGDVTIKEYK